MWKSSCIEVSTFETIDGNTIGASSKVDFRMLWRATKDLKWAIIRRLKTWLQVCRSVGTCACGILKYASQAVDVGHGIQGGCGRLVQIGTNWYKLVQKLIRVDWEKNSLGRHSVVP